MHHSYRAVLTFPDACIISTFCIMIIEAGLMAVARFPDACNIDRRCTAFAMVTLTAIARSLDCKQFSNEIK